MNSTIPNQSPGFPSSSLFKIRYRPSSLLFQLLIVASIWCKGSYRSMAQVQDGKAEPSVSGQVIINGLPAENRTEPGHGITANCQIIKTISPKASFPLGIAWDGAHLWTVEGPDSIIYARDTMGAVVDSIVAGFYVQLSALEYAGSKLYGVEEQSAKLLQIDPATDSIQFFNLPIKNPQDPNLWGITVGGGYAWVSEYGTNAFPHTLIYKLDTTSFSPIDTITILNRKQIFGIEWVDGFLFGVDWSTDRMYKIDTETGMLADSTPWCLLNPYDLDFDSGKIWQIGVKPNQSQYRNYQIGNDFITSTAELGLQSGNQTNATVYFDAEQNHLRIDMNENLPLVKNQCRIMSVEGRVISEFSLDRRQMDIDLSKWPSGLYSCSILGMNGRWNRLFVKP